MGCLVHYCTPCHQHPDRGGTYKSAEQRPQGPAAERALWPSEGPAALRGQGTFPLRVAIHLEPHPYMTPFHIALLLFTPDNAHA